MEHLFGGALTIGSALFLVVALGLALSFECVNGFHDTANAVATVIYTNTLRPTIAVVWSGCWNLIGVLLSSGAVAFGIVALLPVELVMNVGSGAGFAMVFALLISAIIWNVGTWYFGLPASSSHTLIGSIVGVGLANSVLAKGHTFGDGVNWGKVQDTIVALLVSPVVGFVCAALLLLLLKALVKNKELYKSPEGKTPPPLWIRGLLVLTCTGVSFAHGSNDGQKGMGLIMLILIGILPGIYAINPGASAAVLQQVEAGAAQTASYFAGKTAGAPIPSPSDAAASISNYIKSGGKLDDSLYAAFVEKNKEIATQLGTTTSISQLPEAEHSALRSNLYLVQNTIDKLTKSKAITDPDEQKTLLAYRKSMTPLTNFIPTWVKVAVALCLGLGTMVGWKRIVVTVGERIGKDHLTYAQGASAEIVAYATIQAADIYGLPVSTTHILSSGVAGAMVANGSGLQAATVRNIVLAWVLTLPACVFLGSMLFAGGLYAISFFGGARP